MKTESKGSKEPETNIKTTNLARAPDGTQVDAMIDGTLSGSATTTALQTATQPAAGASVITGMLTAKSVQGAGAVVIFAIAAYVLMQD